MVPSIAFGMLLSIADGIISSTFSFMTFSIFSLTISLNTFPTASESIFVVVTILVGCVTTGAGSAGATSSTEGVSVTASATGSAGMR